MKEEFWDHSKLKVIVQLEKDMFLERTDPALKDVTFHLILGYVIYISPT